MCLHWPAEISETAVSIHTQLRCPISCQPAKILACFWLGYHARHAALASTLSSCEELRLVECGNPILHQRALHSCCRQALFPSSDCVDQLVPLYLRLSDYIVPFHSPRTVN